MSKVIGVFDSGVGGLSVVRAIEKAMPEHKVLFVNDTKNVPYGTKSPDELMKLVLPILRDMQQQCNVIVVACNTVTTTLAPELRKALDVPLVGMEPMVKPAAEHTTSKTVAIFATPTTLASARYQWLKTTYAAGVRVLQPDCSDWSSMIENSEIDRHTIEKVTEDVCQAGADVIVLGCTHYHWIEDIITKKATGRAIVLQPEQPVISQLRQVLAQ